MLTRGGRTVADGKKEDVAAASTRQRVHAGAANQRVVAVSSDQRVIPAAALQRASEVVGDQRVIASAADGNLDGRVEGNADIVNQPSDRRETSGMKVDRLGSGIAGAVQRIGASAVVDRQRRCLRISREVEDRSRGAMK